MNNLSVDNLLQSFDLTKIDEEVDKFYVNLVNDNLSTSLNTKSKNTRESYKQ